jgi:hypothetical protein
MLPHVLRRSAAADVPQARAVVNDLIALNQNLAIESSSELLTQSACVAET